MDSWLQLRQGGAGTQRSAPGSAATAAQALGSFCQPGQNAAASYGSLLANSASSLLLQLQEQQQRDEESSRLLSSLQQQQQQQQGGPLPSGLAHVLSRSSLPGAGPGAVGLGAGGLDVEDRATQHRPRSSSLVHQELERQLQRSLLQQSGAALHLDLLNTTTAQGGAGMQDAQTMRGKLLQALQGIAVAGAAGGAQGGAGTGAGGWPAQLLKQQGAAGGGPDAVGSLGALLHGVPSLHSLEQTQGGRDGGSLEQHDVSQRQQQVAELQQHLAHMLQHNSSAVQLATLNRHAEDELNEHLQAHHHQHMHRQLQDQFSAALSGAGKPPTAAAVLSDYSKAKKREVEVHTGTGSATSSKVASSSALNFNNEGAGMKGGGARGHSEQEADVRKDKEWKKKALLAPLSSAAVLNKGTAGKGPLGENKEAKNPRGRPAKSSKPASPLLSSDTAGKGKDKLGGLDALAPLSPLQEKRFKSDAPDASLCKPDRSSTQEEASEFSSTEADPRPDAMSMRPDPMSMSFLTSTSSASTRAGEGHQPPEPRDSSPRANHSIPGNLAVKPEHEAESEMEMQGVTGGGLTGGGLDAKARRNQGEESSGPPTFSQMLQPWQQSDSSRSQVKADAAQSTSIPKPHKSPKSPKRPRSSENCSHENEGGGGEGASVHGMLAGPSSPWPVSAEPPNAQDMKCKSVPGVEQSASSPFARVVRTKKELTRDQIQALAAARRREMSPSLPDAAVPVQVEELREEMENGLRDRCLHSSSSPSQAKEWDWVRKKMVGPGSGRASAYQSWWGCFASTLPLGKRHVSEDLRNINKQAPGKSGAGAGGGTRKEKTWLLKGKPVEVKWDGDWWQAKIKLVKYVANTDKPDKVLVSYVGGTTDDDEWVSCSTRRLRPPTDAFSDTSRH